MNGNSSEFDPRTSSSFENVTRSWLERLSLMREFKSNECIEDVRFIFNASCPFECYLDGKLIQFRDNHNAGAVYRKIENITLTGEKQRLVVKLTSRIPDFNFSVAFCKGSPSRTRAYSPYLSCYSTEKGR
jgi:NAD(P)H-flavin reductase